MFVPSTTRLPLLLSRIAVQSRPSLSRTVIKQQLQKPAFNHAKSFSASKMTDSTNNPDGKKIPKPSEAPSEGRKPIPDTGWQGEIPSHKGGDYEKDFLNKPPYKWTSDKFVPKYKAYVPYI